MNAARDKKDYQMTNDAILPYSHAPGETGIDYLARQRLDGRGVVVLGVGSGIGGAICDALSQAGATLLCVDNNIEVAERAASRTGGHAFTADVSSRAEMVAVFARAHELFKNAFSGVVNVVGVPMPGTIASRDDEQLRREFDLNLHPGILVTQIAGPLLAARGGGSVVFIGALAAQASTLNIPIYSIAKAGVNKLAVAAAHEFGPSHVRFNVVAPGRIVSSGAVPLTPETLTRIEQAVPLRRAGTPADIAGVALFLLSDLAAYVTGAVIPVDGGIGFVSALPGGAPRT